METSRLLTSAKLNRLTIRELWLIGLNLVLIQAKLDGAIDWSWWYVMLPMILLEIPFVVVTGIRAYHQTISEMKSRAI